MTKWMLAAALAATTFALGGTAMADPTKAAAKDSNYGYKFDDDLLQSGVMDPNTPRIRVLKKSTRERLHRPRAQFVTEMLKSVEAL